MSGKSSSKLKMNVKDVRELYCDEGMSKTEICYLYEVDEITLDTFLRRHRITKYKKIPHPKMIEYSRRYDEFRDMKHTAVAKILGVVPSTVCKWSSMKQDGIELIPFAIDQIVDLYKYGLSIDRLAEQFELTPPIIRGILVQEGVEIRTSNWLTQPDVLQFGSVGINLGTGLKMWHDIPGYEGIYKMSDDGEVGSFNRNKARILKQRLGFNRGIPYYRLCKNGDRKILPHSLLKFLVFGEEHTG